MPKILRIVLLATLLTSGFNVHAGTVTYLATEALSDGVFHTGGHNHALWVPGLAASNDWLFAGGGGTFTYDDMAGSAVFTGSLINEGNSSLTGDFAFNFGFSESSNATPKKELAAAAYSENGGPVNTSLWTFFDTLNGSFTGTANLAGLVLELTQRPDPIINPGSFKGQLGDGANGKNADFGYSSWFFWDVLNPCQGDGIQNGADCTLSANYLNGGTGDININLSPVPLPAAFWLFGTALIGLVGFGKRRKAA